jgi:3D (Asp-Asp-Asp) domain-containing protein
MQDLNALKRCRRRIAARLALEVTAFGAVAFVTVISAVWAKESRRAPLLAAVDFMSGPASAKAAPAPMMAAAEAGVLATVRAEVIPEPVVVEAEPVVEAKPEPKLHPVGTRFYDGRPIRAVKTIMMTVTAYSPDERSCGASADGITASTKSVWTNGMRMVAADTRVLPMHSLITVPGYGDDEVVPVLDRGGKIKGKRLDVLYATHEVAMQWGVKRLPITVWEYAD